MPTIIAKPPRPSAAKPSRKAKFKIDAGSAKNIQTVNVRISNYAPFPVCIFSPYQKPESAGGRLACPTCFEFIGQPRQCMNDDCDNHGPLPQHLKPVTIYVEGDTRIVLNDEDMDFLDLPTQDNFVIEAMVPIKEVAELLCYADGMYFTGPETPTSARLYKLVYAYLKKHNLCLVGKYTLRTGAEKLAIMRPQGNNLIIQNVPFAQNRRTFPTWEDVEVTQRDAEVINQVMNELPKEFVYANVRDEYGSALTKLITDTIEEQLSEGKKKRTKKKVDIPVVDEVDDRTSIERIFMGMTKGAFDQAKGKVTSV